MTAVHVETGEERHLFPGSSAEFPIRIRFEDPQPALQIVRKKWIYIILNLLKAPSMPTIAEAAAMLPATARQPVTATRSGAPRPGFEGGQMPLYRRLPKRGFTCYNSKDIVAVDIETLKRFEDGSVVDEQTLLESGAVSKLGDGVKIIGNADLDRKLTVKVTAFSAAAKEKIEAAGGTAETIGR